MTWIPDGLDPDEAADFARGEVEVEIAHAEERERELEAEEAREAEAKAARFDAGLEAYLEELEP